MINVDYACLINGHWSGTWLNRSSVLAIRFFMRRALVFRVRTIKMQLPIPDGQIINGLECIDYVRRENSNIEGENLFDDFLAILLKRPL